MNSISDQVQSNPKSIYFSYDASGGFYIRSNIKISYNSEIRKLEKVEIADDPKFNTITTKNLTPEDEQRFMDILNSSDFFNLKDKYLTDIKNIASGSWSHHLFVFITYQSNDELPVNFIHAVTWQDKSNAPDSLFSLSKFLSPFNFFIYYILIFFFTFF